MNAGATKKFPISFLIIILCGILWNIFGVYQFITTMSGDVGMLMKNGLTEEQATLYASLPLWMNTAFALGVFGGLIGSLILLIKKKLAINILLVSLIGYIVLYIGDITERVFEVFGMPQVIVLSIVVSIAIGLFVYSKFLDKNGYIN